MAYATSVGTTAFGSASKRSIIRSPLEMLADEQTPPPKGGAAGTATATGTFHPSPARKQLPTSSVVHVTQTTNNAREAKPFAVGRYVDGSPDAARHSHHHERRAEDRSPTSSMPPPVRGDEPSTLLFMSPAGVRSSGDLASETGQDDHGASRRHTRAHSSGSRSGSNSRHGKAKRHSVPSDKSSVDNDGGDGDWISRSDAKQAIREALESYEQKRDEEEGRVLEEIRAEVATVHAAKDRAENEATHLKALVEENEALVGKLQAQCSMLSATTESIHEELQQERQRLQRLEIEACHADDGRRAALADAHKDLEFERGQWNAMREELEDQLTRAKETHRQGMEQLQFDAHEQRTRATELEAQLREATKACGQHEDTIQRLSATNAELHAELSMARKELADKTASLHVISKRSQSIEKGDATRRDELSGLQRKVASLEETTRTQNDDIRKKLFRIQVLEGDVQKAVEATKTLGQEYNVAVEKALLVHASVDSLCCTLRSGVKQHVTSALSKVRHADLHDSNSDEDDDDDDSDLSVITRLNDVLTPSGEDEEDDDDSAALHIDGPTRPATGRSVCQQRQHGDARANSAAPPMRSASGGRRPNNAKAIAPPKLHGRPRSSSGPRKDPRRTTSAGDEAAGGGGVQIKKKSIPNTLRLLTRAHERTHTLLRKLHIKDAASIANLDKAKGQAQALTKDIAALTDVKSEAVRERDELRNAVAKLQKRVAAAEEQSTARADEVVALAQEHRDAKARAVHYEERYRRVDYELNELRADFAAKQQAVQLLERTCLQHQEEAQRLAERSQEAAPKQEQLRKDLTAKEKALEEADVLIAKHAREVADVAQHKERLQKQVAKLHAELAHVRSEWAKAQDDNLGLQARVAKLDGALTLARKTANRVSASSAIAANDRRLEDMQAVADGLRVQLKDAQGEAHAVVALKDKELEETNKKLQTYRARLNTVLQQHETAQQAARDKLCFIALLVRDNTQRISTTAATGATVGGTADVPLRRSADEDRNTGSPRAARDEAHQAVGRGLSAHFHPVDAFTPQQAVRVSSPMRSTVAAGSKSAASPPTPAAPTPASTTLTEAVLQLETTVTDALHAWDFHSHQRTLQLHALEQTIAFLELELRCQASQQRQRSHQKQASNALTYLAPASPQQTAVAPLSFVSPASPAPPGAWDQQHAQRRHSGADDNSTAAGRCHSPQSASPSHGRGTMLHQARGAAPSLSPAHAVAVLLEPPSALDAWSQPDADASQRRGSHGPVDAHRQGDRGDAASPGARPPHAGPSHHDGRSAPPKPHTAGNASRSHSPSSEDYRSVSGGVGGGPSSSRSVDGLSASPMRPPSLRSVGRVH